MEEINNKYETTYEVQVYDPADPFYSSKMVTLKAKKIVKTEIETRFFDYYGCISGCFRNDILLGYVKKER